MAGIRRIGALLQKQVDGKPRLYVDKRCLMTIMEFENYSYPENKEGKRVDEKPVKVHDHAMDALRYALMSREEPMAYFSVKFK